MPWAAYRGLIIKEGGLEVESGGLVVPEDGGSISISSTSIDALAVAASSKYVKGIVALAAPALSNFMIHKRQDFME